MADLIAHPSNLVLPHCPQAIITRCLENRIFIVTANRVGIEERISGNPIKFIGQSQIVDPDGKIIYRTSDSDEEIRTISIDIKKHAINLLTRAMIYLKTDAMTFTESDKFCYSN